MSSLGSSVRENSLLPQARWAPAGLTSLAPAGHLSAPSLWVGPAGRGRGEPGASVVLSLSFPGPDSACRLPSPGLQPPAPPANPHPRLSSASVLSGFLRAAPAAATPHLATPACPDLEVSPARPDRPNEARDSPSPTPSELAVPLPVPWASTASQPQNGSFPWFLGRPSSKLGFFSLGQLLSVPDADSNGGSAHTQWCSRRLVRPPPAVSGGPCSSPAASRSAPSPQACPKGPAPALPSGTEGSSHRSGWCASPPPALRSFPPTSSRPLCSPGSGVGG